MVDAVGHAFVPKAQTAQRSAEHQRLDPEGGRPRAEPGLEFGGGAERVDHLLLTLKDLVPDAYRQAEVVHQPAGELDHDAFGLQRRGAVRFAAPRYRRADPEAAG